MLATPPWRGNAGIEVAKGDWIALLKSVGYRENTPGSLSKAETECDYFYSADRKDATTDNVFQFPQPGTFADAQTEVLRNSARALLTQTVEGEVTTLLERQIIAPKFRATLEYELALARHRAGCERRPRTRGRGECPDRNDVGSEAIVRACLNALHSAVVQFW